MPSSTKTNTTKSKATVAKPPSAKKTQKQLRALDEKWGKQTIQVKGWTAIPNLLLERQQALGIDSVDLNILLILMKHWWEEGRNPYPSKNTIADIVGKDRSTVQRRIREMEKNKLLVRRSRANGSGGQASNEHDLSGLVAKLTKLAKAEAADQAKNKATDSRKRRGY